MNSQFLFGTTMKYFDVATLKIYLNPHLSSNSVLHILEPNFLQRESTSVFTLMLNKNYKLIHVLL